MRNFLFSAQKQRVPRVCLVLKTQINKGIVGNISTNLRKPPATLKMYSGPTVTEASSVTNLMTPLMRLLHLQNIHAQLALYYKQNRPFQLRKSLSPYEFVDYSISDSEPLFAFTQFASLLYFARTLASSV